MKKVQIEFDELPFSTLERFGLTREMIEDLPMRVLEDICNGRHSPVLPVRVTDEHGGQIESRSRFAFIRMDDGQVDVVFYPALKSSPLERYDEAQQKQLLDGKAIVADVEMSDGRSSKAFVQIDAETKQVMYVPSKSIRSFFDIGDILLFPLLYSTIIAHGVIGYKLEHSFGQGMIDQIGNILFTVFLVYF